MSGPFHRRRQLALVTKAIARNPAWHDPPALGQKIPQESDVLEINGALFNTKPAGPTALKKPTAAATIAPSSAAPATFPFHNLPLSYCGSSYSWLASSCMEVSLPPVWPPPPPSPRFGIKVIVCATTSCLLRFCPSSVSQRRCCSRPSTITPFPLLRYCPQCSACLPNTTMSTK